MTTGGSFLLALNIAAHFSSLTLPYTERFLPWIQAGAFAPTSPFRSTSSRSSCFSS